jgi:hypothetical protein
MKKQLDHTIVGLHVHDRRRNAVGVQQILTDFGDIVRTRLGLHDVDGKTVSPNGLILLELVGDKRRVKACISALRRCKGTDLKTMVFEHA